MKASGHKTASVFKRYNLVSEEVLKMKWIGTKVCTNTPKPAMSGTEEEG